MAARIRELSIISSMKDKSAAGARDLSIISGMKDKSGRKNKRIVHHKRSEGQKWLQEQENCPSEAA
ncbi:hypothetical protein KW850_24570 [Bacillus sp. sid0103]|uniref:hypothetical protein n=1 Tax=Bacillus sp. sid0103 TaxID=2856337 RepID=UPI001C48FB0F|nr:hypothetical protein [Bacillus sp. sid0103]MBV7508396.1 hypothetical protein [Bacillus sp. sid0103]